MRQNIGIVVPSGIGDFSWIWSKLCGLVKEGIKFQVFTPDCYPQRTMQFLKLIDGVDGQLGQHDFASIRTMMLTMGFETYKEMIEKYPNDEDLIYIEANSHLEDGKPLADFLPDLPTDFHYNLNTTDEDRLFANSILPSNKFNIGIHMASIIGAKKWNAWMPEHWEELLNLLNGNFQNVQFYLLGGGWDRDMAQELLGRLGDKAENVTNLVGKTSIGQAVEVLRKLNYYIGYSSGLNVIRNVVGKPCTALWPKFQKELMYSWADPEMTNRGDYFGFVYDNPTRIYYRVKEAICREYRTWYNTTVSTDAKDAGSLSEQKNS